MRKMQLDVTSLFVLTSLVAVLVVAIKTLHLGITELIAIVVLLILIRAYNASVSSD